ncbi:ATP-binding protein [Streptomyces triculaminicus]|uniref:ATP-binding protein n=1 Tax=Streptomyces triculaminicus TaxID=2816232 RepID=UPI0037D310A9
MTKLIRHPPGRTRPRNAPMATLYPRKIAARFRWFVLAKWHKLTIRWEARGDTTQAKKWRHWVSYTNLIRVLCAFAVVLVLGWFGEGIFVMIRGKSTWFEDWQKGNSGFATVIRFVGPFLLVGLATAIFLFCWYSWTKRRYLRKARRKPHELVPTAGPNTDEVVGRQEITQVIAQRLRDRNTRRPYLLVGGVGTGKTAVLVRLTELLARQGAVPVPIHLRDAGGKSELNFEELAKRRFCDEAPKGILARSKTERVWQQLLADDKPVVIADGLEEAVLDESLQSDRDNIISRAIERADDEKLPLVIASRPHTALEVTRAAIVELEPLSEEAALDFVEASTPEADERRLDWIVETAEVTESPIYLQIARELSRSGFLRHEGRQSCGRPLDTRSRDRSTLRLWLLETWEKALVEGRLRDDVVGSEQDRRDAIEVVSALACLGLLQDKLEVGIAELQGAHLHASPLQWAGIEAEHLWTMRHHFDRYGKRGNGLTEWHRGQIWNTLRKNLSDDARHRMCDGTIGECQAELARCVSNADALELVEGSQEKVRFPHSILQAYFGFRTLRHLEENHVHREQNHVHQIVNRALQPPGPSRELLIALVLLSRRRAAEAVPVEEPEVMTVLKKELRKRYWESVVNKPLTHRLCRLAAQREDPKAFEIYAAALEIESVQNPPEQLDDIVSTLKEHWDRIKGDWRTLDDAKLRVVRRLGAALRAADGKTNSVRNRRIYTTPLYEKLFELGIGELSYAIRLAVAQEVGDGGDSAFALIRRRITDINLDPVGEYEDQIESFKRSKRDRLDRWADELQKASEWPKSPVRDSEENRLNEERKAILQDYRSQREGLWREFVMRAWMLPMLLGSVSDERREEAFGRLTKWLRHLDPKHAGAPDLPLSLENALAQGFKYAANRRGRHPFTYAGGRKDLVRQAETMLQQSRCWYAQLTLIQALCLWELPDKAAASTGGNRKRGARHRHAPQGPPRTAVQTVERWLSMAGTAHTPAARSAADGAASHQPLHPFVAETGDLVALALETKRPERFLWIDEKGVADNIGSRNSGPQLYRKHNLWIPPSIGWSSLDARAQRLVADVLVMLNLIERDVQPDEVEQRLSRSQNPDMQLPPCITTDRKALRPDLKASTSGSPRPGSSCPPHCTFQLCPYPPRGTRLRAELREPFCRQQQTLLPDHVWRRLPRVRRRKTPNWVGMRVTELHGFWDDMAHRLRGP